MADYGLRSTIEIQDQASATLSRVTQNFKGLLSVVEDIDKSLGGIHSDALDELKTSFTSLDSSLNKITKDSKNVTGGLDKINSSAGDVSSSLKDINGQNFNSVIKESNKASKNLESLSTSAGNAESAVEDINSSSLSGLNKTVISASSVLDGLASSASDAQSEIALVGSKTSLANATKSATNAGTAFDKLETEVKQAGDELADIKNDSEKASSGLDGLIGKIGALATAWASVETVKKAISLSDDVTSMNSRLNIINDSYNAKNGTTQTTEQLKSEIFRVSQATRADYMSMQDMVASLGNNAGDSFADTSQMLAFASNVQKSFVNGGSSAESSKAALTQLTQALSSGRLQGDEFVSINENAHELMNVLADGLNVDFATLKEMSTAGELTTDKIISAVLSATDSINDKFGNMQMTFGDMWTQFKNSALQAFDPIQEELSKLANNPDFQASIEILTTKITDLAPAIADLIAKVVAVAPTVLDWLVNGFGFIIDHGDVLIPLIIGIGSAFATFKTLDFVVSAVKNAQLAFEGLSAVFTFLAANPVIAIIAGIVGLITALVWAYNNVEWFRDGVNYAWDMIVTAFNNAWTNIAGFFESLALGWDEAVATVVGFRDNVVFWLTDAYEYICGLPGRIIDSAFEWGNNLVEGFKQGINQKWSEFTGWIDETFGGLITTVKNIFGIASPSKEFDSIGSFLIEGLKNGVESMWNNTVGFLEGLGQKILDIFSPKETVDYSSMIEDTRSQLESLKQEVSAVYNELEVEITNINEAIMEDTISTFGGLSSEILIEFYAIKVGAEESIGSLPNTFTAIFESLLSTTSAYMTAIKVASLGEIIAMVDGLSTSLTTTNAVVNDTINLLDLLGTSGISALASFYSSAISLSSNFSSSYLGIISSMVSSSIATHNVLFTTLLNNWNANTKNVISTFTSFMSRLIALVKTLVNNILNTLGKLPSQVYAISVEMMNQFRAGILAKLSTVLDATSDLVEKVKAVFVKGLGIHSPSHETYWYGLMMAAGLIKGLNDGQVLQFVESIIGDMQNSFANGTFDPMQAVDYLGDDTLKLIAKVIGVDASSVSDAMSVYPLAGGEFPITSAWGYRSAASTNGVGTTNHGGIDIGAPTGTPILATQSGTISTAGWYGGYGNAVVIDHGNGMQSVYGHMSSVGTSVGATVGKGQLIGYVGSTGNSTGPHLHFEVRDNGRPIDPTPYLSGAMLSGNTLASALQQAYDTKMGILSAVNFNPNAGVEQWRSTVIQALTMLGQPTSLTDAVLYAIQSESSGNPNAINNYDSNAMRGDPSRGLLQTIGSTFNAYRNPNLSSNIYDPLSNIYAGLNYMIDKYGSIANVVNPRYGNWYGYYTGTNNARKGYALVGERGPELVYFNGGEVVKNAQETEAILNPFNTIQDIAIDNESLFREREEESLYYSKMMDKITESKVEDNSSTVINFSPNIVINASSKDDTGSIQAEVERAIKNAFEDMLSKTGGTISAI